MIQPPYVSEKYEPCYVEDIFHCQLPTSEDMEL